jgi:hypothetical protein
MSTIVRYAVPVWLTALTFWPDVKLNIIVVFAGSTKLEVDKLATGLAPNCINWACKLLISRILSAVITLDVLTAAVVTSV